MPDKSTNVVIQIEQAVLDQASNVGSRMGFQDVESYLRFCVVSDLQDRTPPKAPPDPKYIRRK